MIPDPFRITVLISGSGTTLKNLIEKKSAGQLNVEMVQVISNNPQAGGLGFANESNIPTAIVDHRTYRDVPQFSQKIFDLCRDKKTNLVVMAGFLRRVEIPVDFVNRVINIHPSLIPAFCGYGHYGSHVHKAVIEYGCKISGCTVHYVDNEYDHGPIIAQCPVPVCFDDIPEKLAARVFEQECRVYPEMINSIALRRLRVVGRTVVFDDDGI